MSQSSRLINNWGPAPPSPSLQRAASAFQRLAEAASREREGPAPPTAAVTLPRWGFWGVVRLGVDEGEWIEVDFGDFLERVSFSYYFALPFEAKRFLLVLWRWGGFSVMAMIFLLCAAWVVLCPLGSPKSDLVTMAEDRSPSATFGKCSFLRKWS